MDKGHREADKILAELMDGMLKAFDKADRKATNKLRKYLRKYEQEIKEHEQLVDDGKMSDAEFERWLIIRTTTGREWEELRDEIADDYHNATSEAMAGAEAGLLSVYAFNKAFAHKGIAKQIKRYFGKEMPKASTKKPRRPKAILPKSPDPKKNRMWHRRKVESVIRSGMKKGKSVDDIARKLHKVTNMDRVSAYRAVRTGVTCAENEARIDAMYEAAKMGIEYDKVWYATLDDRTRTSHRIMHGERVPRDGYFSNDLFEPADPAGDPEEVYNCRCTLLWVPAGIQMDIEDSPEGMGNLEWVATKPVSKPYPRWKDE